MFAPDYQIDSNSKYNFSLKTGKVSYPPMLTIRNKTLSTPLLLAPMAGLTHYSLRRLVLSFGGVGLLSTEMLSARRLPSENPNISPWLIRSSSERPLSYQLLVSDEKEVVPAMAALHRFGADFVDINLGCPAPRVRKSGGGSSLSCQFDLTENIIRKTRAETDLPLTAKIRLGESLDEKSLKDFCLMLEGEGIDMLSVHARLRKESFSRRPRWEWVGKVKEWLNIPVVANGGIFSVEDARKCLQISGADGLMIGRAAPQKPWVFAEIAREIYGVEPALPEISLPSIYIKFMEGLNMFRSERRLGRLKEFTHYFSLNYPFGHHLAMAVQKSNSVEQAWQRAEEFFKGAEPAGL